MERKRPDRRRKSPAWTAVAALLLAVAQPALAAAADDYLDLSPEELLSATITSASKRPETISETPSATYIITHEDIQRAGVTNIPDALRMAPGVQVAQLDANSWAISIRGFNSALANKLLVMIDGRSLYNPLFAGTFWESHDVMLEDVDRIEVVRGPGGTLWGANAVNGIINIITKSAHETKGGLVSALTGNHEKIGVNARYGSAFGDGGAYRVYARHFDRDNTPLAAGGEAYDAWEGYRAGFRADWEDRLVVLGEAFRVHTHELDRLPLVAPRISAKHIIYDGGYILARWRKPVAGGGLWTSQSSLSFYGRDEPDLLEDKRIVFDVETQYDFPEMTGHQLMLGANYRLIADDEGNTRFAVISPAERQDNVFGAFIQDEFAIFSDRWFLTLGTKVENNHYSGWEIQPNARLKWLMDNEQTSWAAVSRAVRTPSRLERDATVAISAGSSLLPNRNFDSEELIAYEVGYRNQIAPAVSLDLAFFYNDYDNLSAFEASGADLRFINGAEGNAWGGELSADWKVRPDWRLSLGYGYLDLSIRASALRFLNEGLTEGNAPHHQASLRSWWDVNEDWSLNTTAHYVSGLESGDIDGYVRLDANAEWRIAGNLKLSLTGQNLLGGRAEFGRSSVNTVDNSAKPERSIFGKLTWEF